jgi:hypothetical protein
MAKKLRSVESIITALGGRRAVAQFFDLHENAIGNWIVADALPTHTYPEIIEGLSKRDCVADINLWNWGRKKSSRRL